MAKKLTPKKNELLQRLLSNSTLKSSAILSESEFFGIKDFIPLPVKALAIAMSGDVDKGLYHGLHMIAGESKTFKTLMGLIMMKAYLDKYEDAIAIFYDTEFGSTDAYMQSVGIDMNRVIHVPLNNLEELKFDVVKQLDLLQKGDRVFFMVDSVGNIASKKEMDDALSKSDKADMTRAKQLKSLYRMVTPYLTTRDVPMIVINHIYMTQELYAQVVVSGGSGGILSANNIWVVSKRKVKDTADKHLLGFDFIISIYKSRMVKEGSKIPLTVLFEGGVSPYSGLLDIALEVGYVVKPVKGKYGRRILDTDTGELIDLDPDDFWTEKQTNSDEFWNPLWEKTDLKEQIKKMYQVGVGSLIAPTEKLFEDA